MTTTSQSDSTDDAPASEAGNTQPEVKKEAQAVPLGEFVEMRQELRKAREELDRLKSLAEGKTAKQPVNPQTSDAQLAEAVRDLQRRERLRGLTSELGLAAQQQADVVAKILDENPGLKAEEAKSIAQVRNPELFKDDQDAGFNPAVHGSMRPRSVSANPEPPQSDFKQRTEHLRQLHKSSKEAYHRGYNNLVGHFAAKAMKREHDLLPIPKRNA